MDDDQVKISMLILQNETIIITANSDISKIEWYLSDLKKIKTIKICDGNIILIKFEKRLNSLKLKKNSEQTLYRGPSILEYLKTDLTEFGEFINNTNNSNVSKILFATISASIISGLIACNNVD